MEKLQKKHIRYLWRRFRSIRPIYLVVALVCMVFVTAFALRHNNQRMVELRQAVYQADEHNGDVESALRELRQYVYSHMNTDLSAGNNAVYPPIQLKYTYERLLAAEQEKARQENEQIYTEAQAHCERLHPESYSGGPRVPCVRDYVAERGIKVKTIPDSLYKFDFVSPKWTPDFAGWSLVVTVLLGIVTLMRVVLPVVLKKLHVL